MAQEIADRVTSLEKTLQDFIRHTDLGFAKVQNALIEQKQSNEEFKAEMRLLYERSEKGMKEFKEEMRLSHERSEKKMDAFKTEMNKKWGELANRLGTLAEDFVAPNIPFIANKYFQCSEQPEFFTVRSKKRHITDKSRSREFDIIAVYKDKVILNETKSTPRQQYVDDFAQLLPVFNEFFPEYSDREIVPIFASLYVDEQIVQYATKQGIYVLALKGDSMDLLNYSLVKASA